MMNDQEFLQWYGELQYQIGYMKGSIDALRENVKALDDRYPALQHQHMTIEEIMLGAAKEPITQAALKRQGL